MAAYDFNADYQTIDQGFLNEARQTLISSLERIEHCVGQLDNDGVWHRSSSHVNAIGNLLLHLHGNIGQWLLTGVGGAPDTRRRSFFFFTSQI